jgi:hypothetical protein
LFFVFVLYYIQLHIMVYFKEVFNVFVIIALLAVLYGFYNIMYSHEDNREDFLIYKKAEKRGFSNLDSH